MNESTLEETTKVICQLKKNKAPGQDRTPAEGSKYVEEAFYIAFHNLVLKLWRTKEMEE